MGSQTAGSVWDKIYCLIAQRVRFAFNLATFNELKHGGVIFIYRH